MLNTKSLTEKSGHLAWCAMIALQMAKRDGLISSESQENLFLIRWLATAMKQRRFPREVTPDIEWLLKQGRRFGVRAKLRHKLDYLWRSCTGELSEQNDLFRLTYVLETAKEMHWTYRLLSDREWSGRYAVSLNTTVNGIHLSRTGLDAAFDDNGSQLKPLMVCLTGNIGGIEKLLNRCGWQLMPERDISQPHLYRLIATAAVDFCPDQEAGEATLIK